MFSVNKDSLYFLLCNTAPVLLFSIASINSVCNDELGWMNWLGALAIFNMLYFLYLSKKNFDMLLSAGFLYVLFYCIFCFGMDICETLNYTSEDYYMIKNNIIPLGIENFFGFSIFCYLLLVMMEVGYFEARFKKKQQSEENDSDIIYSSEKYNVVTSIDEQQLEKCRKVAIVMLVIVIIPTIFVDYLHLSATLSDGRFATLGYELTNNPIDLIADMNRLAILILLYSYQKDAKKFDIIMLIVIAYMAIRMTITGERGLDLINICVIILMRHYLVKPIKIKQSAILLIATYFTLVMLEVIGATRFDPTASKTDAFSEIAQTNIFMETFFSYGTNIWNGLMVYASVPSTGSFRFGTTYIAALLGKPLSFLGIDGLMTLGDFSNFLKEPERGQIINSLTNAMGGFFSGEIYFNFGWFSLLIAPFLGYAFGCLDYRLLNKKENSLVNAWMYYILLWIIWWIRAYFTAMSWYFEVYGITTILICLLLFRRNNQDGEICQT